MNSKTKKAVAAWKQAMQQDLDERYALVQKGDWLSERKHRLDVSLERAVNYLHDMYGICTSFSQGKKVVIQTVNRLGCLVTL